MPRPNITLFILLLVGLLAAGCGADTATPHTTTLNVFAAASLTESFTAMAKEFEASHPGVNVALNFAGSQALRLQIEQGAPVDVFASANIPHMQALQDMGLVGDSVIFTQNRLTVIVPANNPAGVGSLADLTQPGLKMLVAAKNVPVGRYTRTALNNLNTRFGPTYAQQVLANVVSEEDNVKSVVAKVQLGEVDAGIVYESDVTPAVRDDVLTLEIPFKYNVIAEYPLAAARRSQHPQEARQFIEFVLSGRGQTVLAAHGLRSTQLQAIGREE